MLSQINLHASHASTSAHVCLIGETGPLTTGGDFGFGGGFGFGVGGAGFFFVFGFRFGFGLGQWDAVNFFPSPNGSFFPTAHFAEDSAFFTAFFAAALAGLGRSPHPDQLLRASRAAED